MSRVIIKVSVPGTPAQPGSGEENRTRAGRSGRLPGISAGILPERVPGGLAAGPEA